MRRSAGFAPAPPTNSTISGRFPRYAEGDGGGNLVLKARDLLREAVRQAGFRAGPVRIHLEKNLPVASGIGGGSADAAATLRGLMRSVGTSLPAETLDSDCS
jgi:4-diphosphocytidyl-2-C-methyl-D-erythritol kinase